MDRTHDGRPIKIMSLIDEYSRQFLTLVVDRSIKSDDVLHSLNNLCGKGFNRELANGVQYRQIAQQS